MSPLIGYDDDELRPGTQLDRGRFKIVSRLGKGGGASVYRAAMTGRPEDVALKILARERHGDPEAEQRFANEALLAKSLANVPRVVRVLESGTIAELQERAYIALDLVKGPSLATRLIGQPESLWVAVELCAKLARTVEELHAHRVIHRDIKPGNIVVTRDGGVPYLIDFGIARYVGKGQISLTAGLTKEFQRPGTMQYMAPEQALGEPVHASFDIYALAAVLYEMLVGRPPFFGVPADKLAVRKCSADKPAASIVSKVADLPEALAQLVDAGLRREAAARIGSAREFAARLEALLEPATSTAARAAERRRTLVAPDEAPAQPGARRRGALAPSGTLPALSAEQAALIEAEVSASDLARSPRDRPPPDRPPPKTEPALPPSRTRPSMPATPAATVPTAPPVFALPELSAPVHAPRGGAKKWTIWLAAGAVALVTAGVWMAQDDPPDEARPPANASLAAPPSADARPPAPATAPPGNPAHAPSPSPSPPDAPPADARPVVPGSPGTPQPGTNVIDPTGGGGDPEPTAPPEPSPPPAAVRPAPAPPKWAGAACATVRETARADLGSRRWGQLLERVSGNRKCWRSGADRLALHVAALVGLQRYEQCAQVAGRSKDKRVQRMAKQCQRKIGNSSP